MMTADEILHSVSKGMLPGKAEAVELLKIKNHSREFYHLIAVANKLTRFQYNRKGLIFAQIGLMQEKWKDIIYQITEQNYTHILEIFKLNVLMMSREQIIALIYHELRHIGKDGSIINHDIEDWTNMVEKLGVDWSKYEADIPNILKVDWDSIEGPANLFPAETILRVVK